MPKLSRDLLRTHLVICFLWPGLPTGLLYLALSRAKSDEQLSVRFHKGGQLCTLAASDLAAELEAAMYVDTASILCFSQIYTKPATFWFTADVSLRPSRCWKKCVRNGNFAEAMYFGRDVECSLCVVDGSAITSGQPRRKAFYTSEILKLRNDLVCCTCLLHGEVSIPCASASHPTSLSAVFAHTSEMLWKSRCHGHCTLCHPAKGWG